MLDLEKVVYGVYVRTPLDSRFLEEDEALRAQNPFQIDDPNFSLQVGLSPKYKKKVHRDVATLTKRYFPIFTFPCHTIEAN